MLSYRYEARNPKTGQRIKAVVQAQSINEASQLLRNQGLTPIDIKPNDNELAGISKHFSRVKTKDRVLFSRQLATLLNAGLPILQSLQAVSNQITSKPLKVVINQVITDLEGGDTLSAAMAKFPEVFNNIYVSLVAAGETSGTLDVAFERLATQQEKEADIISKIRGAMAYPVIVVLVMIAVVTFMLVKVLPQVQLLYASLPGAQLPLVTRILLSISRFIVKWWWIILIVLVVMVFASSRYAKTVGGKRIVDKIKMHAGPIGTLYMKVYMARFARTGSVLIASGVPIIQMLDITGTAVDNVYIQDALKSATEKIKGGKSLAAAIRDDPNFLELVPNMLQIGEQSGTIEQMLSKVADYYEKEVDDAIKNINSLLEPILMVILGLVAMVIVAAVLLPVYSLAGQTSLTSAF